MDGLLCQFKGDSVKVIGYADDILLYVVGSVPTTLVELIQKGLDRVHNWGPENGLAFNPTKTQTVLFTRNRRAMNKPHPKLDGKALEYSDSLKYLGV